METPCPAQLVTFQHWTGVKIMNLPATLPLGWWPGLTYRQPMANFLRKTYLWDLLAWLSVLHLVHVSVPHFVLAKAQAVAFLAHFNTFQQRSRTQCMVTCCFLGGGGFLALGFAPTGEKELHESITSRQRRDSSNKTLSHSFIYSLIHVRSQYRGPTGLAVQKI